MGDGNEYDLAAATMSDRQNPFCCHVCHIDTPDVTRLYTEHGTHVLSYCPEHVPNYDPLDLEVGDFVDLTLDQLL